ncbi:cdc42-interacting protein 4-like isoform X1 [Silurus asotus]|uniref:Cdc42-interacting protein 4-like isoform X1 n=1 Tax=Silurus asotus TaxID=30991 RepID=A0AAD5FM77_SILAS|nr:cdc42-interacting protein 4-like isoform X1 [Silurus asotus]
MKINTRNLTKKYSPKRGSKEEHECRFSNHQAFLDILNEMNDYAGQRELIAENMMMNICIELSKYLQELKLERKSDSMVLIEQHKSGFERPGDLEFEDYSQGINRASSDSSLGTPKGPLDLLGKNKSKPFWLFSKKSKCCTLSIWLLQPSSSSPLTPFSTPPAPSPANGPPSPKFARDPLSYCLKEINKTVKPRISSFRTLRRTKYTLERIMPAATEDFGHLPPEQRRKRLQQKIDDISKELQKELDQSEALGKMKDVYEKNPQMGDPASLAPQITQTTQNIEKLRGELNKYESWLAGAGGRGDATLRYSTHSLNNNGGHNAYSPDGAHSDESTPDPSQAIYAEFDDDFEEEELSNPIGQCTALYNFPGSSEGTISMQEGEVLAVVEEDKGDGWTRVRRNNGDEGYIPTSYANITLNK